MGFKVRYTEAAQADLVRLYRFQLDRMKTVEESALADDAYEVITSSIQGLVRSPFLYRKCAGNPFHRELLIPFGSSGYVALFEIDDHEHISILAVRHQLEDDYH